MNLKNEGRRPTQSNNIPSTAYVEKLQKKLLQTLETNYEVNKKYGNILSNSNESSILNHTQPLMNKKDQQPYYYFVREPII